MKIKKSALIISIVVILSSLLLICSPAFSQMTALETRLYNAAKKEGALNWWDTLNLKEASKFINTFKKKYPGIKIKFFEGTVDVLEEKYLAEHAAGRHTADFIEIDVYNRFKQKGLLQDLSELQKDTGYDKKFFSKGMDAVCLEHTVYGVAYNPKKLPPEQVAHSFEELLDPRFKGKINVESRLKMFITLTPSWGEAKVADYLGRLRQQNPTFTKGTTYTLTLLGAGEFPIAVGMSIHGMLKLIRRGAPLAMMPISPLADKLSPHVILTDAPHPNAAKLFTRWFMSKEGQLFMDKVRHKGSPMPGAGTSQSKLIEKMGLDVVAGITWDLDYKRLQEKYEKAIGFTKSKLKAKKKKKK